MLIPIWTEELLQSKFKVTRSGDFLDYGELFKVFDNN